ncbi:hypothetical protein B0H15DRAFT_773118 [Mycena belliarum]|uniref:Uncharacterized protein n=1 Tax=Mycena belliarum TaxID=1033014 RepID=A0AAD6UGB0_9AGAR|nr:hypothetical protein B0H15DRAFT_773118 [Mycena belliae]
MARTHGGTARTRITAPPSAGAPTTKQKRPPTFRHFPINRAAKLKQAWVQNVKLKSKWKAERSRTLGLNLNEPKPLAEDPPDDVEQRDEEPEISTKARVPTPALPPKKRARRALPDPTSESSNAPSLRERAREAYSQASLHTYKSESFGKKQRGEKPACAYGRGQPNMKLRMNVLLDTIKRDFT